jgi:hypothetical protein
LGIPAGRFRLLDDPGIVHGDNHADVRCLRAIDDILRGKLIGGRYDDGADAVQRDGGNPVLPAAL